MRSFLLIAPALPTCENSDKKVKKVLQELVSEPMTCGTATRFCIRYTQHIRQLRGVFIDVYTLPDLTVTTV